MLKADLGVLILIVVEDGLVPFRETDGSKKTNGLNPCCSGQWSRTASQPTRRNNGLTS